MKRTCLFLLPVIAGALSFWAVSWKVKSVCFNSHSDPVGPLAFIPTIVVLATYGLAKATYSRMQLTRKSVAFPMLLGVWIGGGLSFATMMLLPKVFDNSEHISLLSRILGAVWAILVFPVSTIFLSMWVFVPYGLIITSAALLVAGAMIDYRLGSASIGSPH